MIQKFFKNKKRACIQCLKHSFCRRGFTLVETLVAISIFSISILGLLSVMASSISNTIYAKNKMTAGYLAQEGLEYIRNIRDTNVLYFDSTSSQNGWNNFLTGTTSGGVLTKCVVSGSNYGCYLGDPTSINFSSHTMPINNPALIVSCTSSSCPGDALNYNSSTGVYGSSGSASGFTRQIIIIPITIGGATDEVNVTSVVSWKQGSGTYNITLSENLYNWVTQYYQ